MKNENREYSWKKRLKEGGRFKDSISQNRINGVRIDPIR